MIGMICSQITTSCHKVVALILRNLVAKVTLVLDLRSYRSAAALGCQDPILLIFVKEKVNKKSLSNISPY